MRWARLAGLVVPPCAFWLVAHRHPGFARQPQIVGAGEAFASEVQKAGGWQAVRTGVWLDCGFIVTLTVSPGVLLARSGTPVLASFAGLAAAVDVAEDLVLLRALRDPTPTVLRGLRTTSRCKVAAYAVLLGTVAWRGLR